MIKLSIIVSRFLTVNWVKNYLDLNLKNWKRKIKNWVSKSFSFLLKKILFSSNKFNVSINSSFPLAYIT